MGSSQSHEEGSLKFEVDADGIVTGWNEPCEAVFDCPASTVIGCPLRTAIPLDNDEQVDLSTTHAR